MLSDGRAFVEAPVLFGRDQSLVGSTCVPLEDQGGRRSAVLFITSGIIHRTGPNRIYVRIARALAAHGFSSLRFDLSGVGDSVLPPAAAGMSIQERVEIDIDDAIELARARFGVERFVLLGLCSGADNALRTQGRRRDVVGSILLDLNTHRTFQFWVRHYRRRLFRIRPWIMILTGKHVWIRGALRWARGRAGRERAHEEPFPDAPRLNLDAWIPRDQMRDHFKRITARGDRLLCIFTAGLTNQYNYRKQLLHVLRGIDLRGRLRLAYYADSDHTFSREKLQERLVDAIVKWMVETDSAAAQQRPELLVQDATAPFSG